MELWNSEDNGQFDVGGENKFQQIQEESFEVSVNSLVEFIHVTEGFSGNITHYYDPENSYLNRVIERKRGIPIIIVIAFSSSKIQRINETTPYTHGGRV